MCALLGFSVAAPAEAQPRFRREVGPIWGGRFGPPPPERPAVPIDPLLPTGARLRAPARPTVEEAPACSALRPVCVHRGSGVSPEVALAALASLERAWMRVVLSLALPAPLGDEGRGGSDALDVYLEAGAVPAQTVHSEPEWTGSWDRAAAFCSWSGTPVDMDRAATLCIGGAIAARFDPGETPHFRRAYATHLWWLVGTPGAADMAELDDVQSHPELAVAARDRTDTATAGALLLSYLDSEFSKASPGYLATGMLALGASRTEAGAERWHNEPDSFDVLRSTFDNRLRRLAELLADFAVHRAFAGSRSDGQHGPDTEWAGDFGRIRFDWTLPLSSFPRRVAATEPIEPTGAVYVYVPIDEPISATTEIGLRAEWESPVPFAWTIVKLDGKGNEIGRVNVKFSETAQKTERTLRELPGVAALLIVGTNLGGVDLEFPFDPDIAPFEPHGLTVYVTKL